MSRWRNEISLSERANTKIDFRKLLATVHGLPNSTNRFGSGAVKRLKTHNYIKWTKYFLGLIVAGLLLSKI